VGIDVAISEPLVQQIRAAAVNLAIGHYIGPVKRCGVTFFICRYAFSSYSAGISN
jgi:hypothetical protein